MLRIFLCLIALMTMTQNTIAAETEFYLGTFSDNEPGRGIFRGTLNSETGELGPIQLAAVANNPAYITLSPNKQFLYATLETKEGAAVAYKKEADGSLTYLNQQSMEGHGACHISTDLNGKTVFVANYRRGYIASYPVHEDGSLGEEVSNVTFEGSGPNPKRQTTPHAHCVVLSPDGKHLYACDLGTDKVWIFDYNPATSKLTAASPAFASLPPGAGPRHIVFSADGAFAYVNNEMGLSTSMFSRNQDSGELALLETVPIHLDSLENTEGVSTAAILMHPSGKWLYVSSRGDDIVAVYAVGNDGTLKLIQNAEAKVEIPRGAAIDPSGKWLLVGGQHDNQLSILIIDTNTGMLSPSEQAMPVLKPVCVSF